MTLRAWRVRGNKAFASGLDIRVKAWMRIAAARFSYASAKTSGKFTDCLIREFWLYEQGIHQDRRCA